MSSLHAGGRRIRVLAMALFQRDGGVCGRCGGSIDPTLSGSHPDGLTIGHVLAWRLGGGDAMANLRPEHRSCNVKAGIDSAPPRALIARPVFRRMDISRKPDLPAERCPDNVMR